MSQQRPVRATGRAPTLTIPTARRRSLFEGVASGNVGNVFQISPAEATGALLNSYGRPVRVLEIAGSDDLGGMLCVSLQQESDINAGFILGGTQFPEGPLVGSVEWGAGAGLDTLEFDIPAPVTAPGIVVGPGASPGAGTATALPVARRTNGAFLTLPASSMRVFVRNDARAPYLIDPTNPTFGLNLNNTNPATIRAHATYGRRTTQCRLTRSYPICARSSGAITAGLLPGQSLRIGIPPYARFVSFPRLPLVTGAAPPLTIEFVSFQIGQGGNVLFRGNYTIQAGEDGRLEVFPYDTVMDITNPGPATVADMAVVFELEV